MNRSAKRRRTRSTADSEEEEDRLQTSPDTGEDERDEHDHQDFQSFIKDTLQPQQDLTVSLFKDYHDRTRKRSKQKHKLDEIEITSWQDKWKKVRDQLNTQNKDLEGYASTKEDLKNTQAELLKVERSLEDKEVQLQRAQVELEEKGQKHQEIIDVIPRLISEREELNDQYQSSLRCVHSRFENILKELLAEIRGMEQENEVISQQLEEERSKTSHLQAKVEGSQKEKEEWEKISEDWKSDKLRWTNDNQNLSSRYSQLQADSRERQRLDQAAIERQDQELKYLKEHMDRTHKHAESRIEEMRDQIGKLETDKQALAQEKEDVDKQKEQMLERNSDLESSCEKKDEQIKQLTDLVGQTAKDLVRGASQILEIAKECNTSHSYSGADQAQLQRPATSPRSPGERDISEVEDATSIQAPSSASPTVRTIEPEIPVNDGFLFHPVQQVAWDNPKLTSTDHLTPHLPSFWKTAFSDLECWKKGEFCVEILRVLLTSLSVSLPPQLHGLIRFSGMSSADCNFRAVNNPKCDIWICHDDRNPTGVYLAEAAYVCSWWIDNIKRNDGRVDMVLVKWENWSQRTVATVDCADLWIVTIRLNRSWVSKWNSLEDFFSVEPTSTTHFGPATEQEKWDNFQLCRQAAAWIVEHREEGRDIYRKEGKD